MVLHNPGDPLGHIVTSRLWQDDRHNDLHFTVSDNGWARCAWGTIFGQWIDGACIFVYHFTRKYQATGVLPHLEKYQITTFCSPPAIWRMPIPAYPGKFDPSSLRHCTSTGEPLFPEVIRVWKEGTCQTICEGYGQTGTACCVAAFLAPVPRPGSMGNRRPAGRSRYTMMTANRSETTKREDLRSAASRGHHDCLQSVATIPKRTRRHLSAAGTTRAIRSAGMMADTCGLSGGAMMLSGVPGTVSGRSRSRAPCSGNRLCRNQLLSGRLMGSGG